MNKSEFLDWLQQEHQQWETLLKRIGPARMAQIGVNSLWSFKDLLAHLIPDAVRSIAHIQAGQRGEPEPPPPWPTHLQNDDDINAWIYETNRELSVSQVLDTARQTLQQLFAMVNELPEDVKIDTVQQGERVYYLVQLGEQRIQAGYFFDHFHDDHEQDVLAWLSQMQKE